MQTIRSSRQAEAYLGSLDDRAVAAAALEVRVPGTSAGAELDLGHLDPRQLLGRVAGGQWGVAEEASGETPS
jgi:hypothetical protein